MFADPATKRFMSSSVDNVFGFPQFVRFSWSTASLILEDKAAPVEWSVVYGNSYICKHIIYC